MQHFHQRYRPGIVLLDIKTAEMPLKRTRLTLARGIFACASGYTARAFIKDYSTLMVPTDMAQRVDFRNVREISFLVEGENSFSGGPTTKMSGRLYPRELDLETIQKINVSNVLGNLLRFEKEAPFSVGDDQFDLGLPAPHQERRLGIASGRGDVRVEGRDPRCGQRPPQRDVQHCRLHAG